MTLTYSGIQFKETMAGDFSMQANEPFAGAAIGREKDTVLTMHAQVDIDNIDRFVGEPNHAGRLSGSIDFAPLGMGIKAKAGVFNLFYPTDDPKLKLMVYELGFSYQEQDYYLAGKKEVKDDPGFDLWTDTTTLYTYLHAGTDKSALICGAGILTLGVKDLVKLISTITVLNANSSSDKLSTITKFGRFFMGQLWDTYAPHIK